MVLKPTRKIHGRYLMNGKPTIAVLGTGTMGAPIARNLLRAGFGAHGRELPTTAALAARWQATVAAGHDEEDIAVIITTLS
jgi:3-hydroxyisobutyrate dehydrogenase-like beta-hydroxyacid dehydrogenase